MRAGVKFGVLAAKTLRRGAAGVALLLPGCFWPTGLVGTTESATTEATTTNVTSATTGTMTTVEVTTTAVTEPAPTTTTSGTTGTTGTTAAPTSSTTLAEMTLDTLSTLETLTEVLGECGDGVKNLGEECDDGNRADGDGCDQSCVVEFLVVFVSSDLSKGTAIGGLDGADSWCNALAAEGKPELAGRTFVAWLSTTEEDAIDRIGDSELEYRLTDLKTKVTTGAAGFGAGALETAIEFSETGMPPVNSQIVWTGTQLNGIASAHTCMNWSDNGTTGTVGEVAAGESTWTDTTVPQACQVAGNIYCIEKPET